MVQVVCKLLARHQREQRRREAEALALCQAEQKLPEAQRHDEDQGQGSLRSEAMEAPRGADGEQSVTLWLLDNESIRRQPKEFLGTTQVADMFATELAGVDMVMKVMRAHARTFVEAALLLRLDGRAGAPRLLGYGAERPMLLLEAVPGCNFLFLLQDADAPLSLHLQVVLRVVQHLQEMHALDVIHNDVAIPNVVVHVDADYQLRDVHLVEFTVACESGDTLALDADPDDFPCVAPDVARGGASTPAADVFSLGALLRELSQVKASADALPLQAQEAAELATQEDPEARPDLGALEKLLRQAVAWQKNKERRRKGKKARKQKA